METVTQCPLCASNSLSPFLQCTDYTVSKEQFTIVQCNACDFRFTNPRPESNKAGAYYQSEKYISHSNTRKGIINGLYQQVRKITVRRKLELVASALGRQQGNLLDMGCGTGEFLNIAKQNGWAVQGIEPSEQARTLAEKHYGLNVYPADSWNVFADNSFDAVTAWHVLEHVYDLANTAQQLKRILSPAGMLIAAMPNCSSADALFYGKYWAAYDVPRHLWHFTPTHVKSFFEKQGFILKAVLPMPLDAYYIAMMSEKYKGGNVNYGRAVVHGFFSNSAAKKESNTYSSQVYILQPVK